jgi:hypothetical protein
LGVPILFEKNVIWQRWKRKSWQSSVEDHDSFYLRCSKKLIRFKDESLLFFSCFHVLSKEEKFWDKKYVIFQNELTSDTVQASHFVLDVVKRIYTININRKNAMWIYLMKICLAYLVCSKLRCFMLFFVCYSFIKTKEVKKDSLTMFFKMT